MKKGHFLWSAHRITEKQKAGKARNIKGKRQSKNFSTVSKQPVVLLSSPSVNFGVSVWFTPVCPCKKFTGPFGKIFPEGLFGSLFFHIIRTGMAEPSGPGIPVLVCDMQFTNYRTPNLVPRLSVPLLFHSV